MSNQLKIGIIGVGSIAQAHIRGYLQNPNAELYAFCDINEERLKKNGEKYGVTRLYTDKEQMLKELPELDAVSVCTWNSQHAPCTIAALKAGKNVLCEKPMALNAQEALEMEAAAKESGKLLMIGFVRRYGNDCRIVKDFIDNGCFGDLYYSKATYLRRNGWPGGWFGDKSRSGGGPLIDLGVHVIDLTRYLMGNPQPVAVFGAAFHKLANRPGIKDKNMNDHQAAVDGEKPIFDVEDSAVAMIRYDNGAVMSVETAFSLDIKKEESVIQLFGTKAGAKLDPELEMYTTTNGYMSNIRLDTPTALSFEGLFNNEIDHYIDCLLGKTECRSPAADGVTLMKILDAIYKSAETGHEAVIE